MNYVARNDFTKYKKIKPISSLVSVQKETNEVIDIIDSNTEITQSEKDDYILNYNNKNKEQQKNVEIHEGFLLPYVKKFTRKTGENGERVVFFITGSSGSGKTYIATKLSILYRDMNKKNKIIWISPKMDNKDLKIISNAKIKLNTEEAILENFYNEETKIIYDNQFNNSLVIIDDIEGINIPDKKINTAVHRYIQSIIDTILNVGRHNNTSLIYINHKSCNGHETAKILNECDYIINFPRNTNNQQLNYLYKTYFGFDNNKIKYIKNSGSRYCAYHNRYPFEVILQHELIL